MKTQRNVSASVGTMLVLLAGPALGAGRIIYVDARASGADDGSSWEDAYVYLQDALADADAPTEPVEICVAQGTYKPDQMSEATRARLWQGRSTREYAFMLKNSLTIKGGYPGVGARHRDERSVDTYESILSGDLAGNDVAPEDASDTGSRLTGEDLQWQMLFDYTSHPSRAENSLTVVRVVGTDGTAVLDGFTITGGHANVPGELAGPENHVGGAGMVCDRASPTVLRCTFARNTTYRVLIGDAAGAGIASFDSRPMLEDCRFVENVAFGDLSVSRGGAMYSERSYPRLTDCVFSDNAVAGLGGMCAGGAMYNSDGSATLIRCAFESNTSLQDSGGAVYHDSGQLSLTDCVFEKNVADYGGAIYNAHGSRSVVTGCLFLENAAVHFGRGGAVYSSDDYRLTFSRCFFAGNSAGGDGGGLYNAHGSQRAECTLANCAFSGNSARRGGALYSNPDVEQGFTNCTFAANEAHYGGALYNDQGEVNLKNSILWLNTPDEIYVVNGMTEVTFSDVQGGWFGTGNINADPQFARVAGVDGVIGTEDDDLRLSLASPCIDAGDSTVVSPEMATDLDGRPRIAKRDIDMGAYEFDGPFDYYVDAVNGSDTNGGWSPQDAFATIQRGIDAAPEGYDVMVAPGVYREAIDFKGKAITVTGMHGAPVLQAPDEYAVSFYSAEGSDSVLQHFVITNSEVGVFVSGSSPTLRNVTLAGNGFGVAAYAGANPDISSCILSGNTEGDLFGCTARFSCVEQGAEGQGNISAPPLFANPADDDYHLLSERGRHVSAHGLWAFDAMTSPCIDAGDPGADVGAERMPNGGRINMGAFGGTAESSLSEWALAGDLNRDGIVDLHDLAMVLEHWLETLPTGAVVDATAPQPDPARWDLDALPREIVGTGGGPFDFVVQMKAVQAVDPSGPVEYFFECYERPDIAPDGFSSGWQTDRLYTVAIGRMGQGLRFRVKARDQCGNETQWSSVEQTISVPVRR